MTNNHLTYIKDQVLWEYKLRMAKDYTSFFYFTLEANENIAFYSTLSFEKGQGHRDLSVYVTPELKDSFENILAHCKKSNSIEILSLAQILDS